MCIFLTRWRFIFTKAPLIFFSFWWKDLLYSPGWSWTCEDSVSAFWVLRLEACTTMTIVNWLLIHNFFLFMKEFNKYCSPAPQFGLSWKLEFMCCLDYVMVHMVHVEKYHWVCLFWLDGFILENSSKLDVFSEVFLLFHFLLWHCYT